MNKIHRDIRSWINIEAVFGNSQVRKVRKRSKSIANGYRRVICLRTTM